MDVNGEFTITQDIEEELPVQYAKEPPVLKGRVLKRVIFDGVDAVLIEAHTRSYNHVSIPESQKNIWIAVDAVTRYYYDTASGRIIWFETDAQTKDASGGIIARTISRERIWPK